MDRSKKEGDSPRWEWRLPGGERTAATLDARGTESVFLDGRLVSSAPRGTKPDGHVVPATGASEDAAHAVVVTFDPRLVICILRVGREEIAPDQWPRPRKSETLAPPRSAFPLGAVVALLLAAVLVAGGVLVTVRLRASSREGDAPLAGFHRAENGLFVAHFPKSFTSRVAVVPSGMSGVVLEEHQTSNALVILAQTTEDALRDPWAMQKQAHGEALANLPRAGGAHVETGRSDGTCLGQPGAIVLGRVTSTRGAPATLWSCSFFRGGDGYLVMYMLAESATAEDATRLRRILDATELTRLAPTTSAPP